MRAPGRLEEGVEECPAIVTRVTQLDLETWEVDLFVFEPATPGYDGGGWTMQDVPFDDGPPVAGEEGAFWPPRVP